MATSKIIGGSETFTCTASSKVSSGNANGKYDRTSGIVTIVFHAITQDTFGIEDAMFTIPSAYRPKVQGSGSCVYVTSSTTAVGLLRVGTDGSIMQRGSSSAKSVFGVAQYII